MANRKNLSHSELVRNRIKTSALVNRLVAFVNGEIELSPAQVTAALGLIRKTLPDLSNVDSTIKGDVNAPLVITQADARL